MIRRVPPLRYWRNLDRADRELRDPPRLLSASAPRLSGQPQNPLVSERRRVRMGEGRFADICSPYPIPHGEPCETTVENRRAAPRQPLPSPSAGTP
jgi:hypothetical protein